MKDFLWNENKYKYRNITACLHGFTNWNVSHWLLEKMIKFFNEKTESFQLLFTLGSCTLSYKQTENRQPKVTAEKDSEWDWKLFESVWE